MLVQMRKQIGGFRNLEPWPAPGGVIDVPDGEARDLIAHGYAVAVLDPAEEVTTDEPSAEDDDVTPAVDDDEAATGEWFDETAADDVDDTAPKRPRKKS